MAATAGGKSQNQAEFIDIANACRILLNVTPGRITFDNNSGSGK